MDDDSISERLGKLNEAEAEAAQRLWERYAHELINLARLKLLDIPCRTVDEEDIALSVFASVCRAAANGRFNELQSRDDLWWLLLNITKQKVVNYVRRETAQKRGQGRVRAECDLASKQFNGEPFTLDALVSRAPTADFVVTLQEEYDRLLAKLRDDRLRQIAGLRIEGYSVAEISAKIGVGERAIERKLQLIRTKWSREMGE